MIDYINILENNINGVLATIDDNQVKTRVFQYLFAEDKKIYFCTSSEKPVYNQLQKNPQASFCTYTKDYAPVLSISGKVTFEKDGLSSKVKALEKYPGLKEIFGKADNPVFKIFYIEISDIETFDFTSGTKCYSL